MRTRTTILTLLLTASATASASAQSCYPWTLPGPPLIEYDLTNVRGSAWVGPDGVVRQSTGPDFFFVPREGTSVEFNGQVLELPGLLENRAVKCMHSTVVYPTSTGIRMMNLDTGAKRDFALPIPWTRVALDIMSDGSLWYRDRDAAPTERGVEWHRLHFEEGHEIAYTPVDAVLMDAHDDKILLGERKAKAYRGRAVWVVERR